MYNEKKDIAYLSIMEGQIVRRVSSDFEGAVSRVNKKGKEVWEKFYPSITATITDILVENTDYGKQWAIMLRGEENGEESHAKLTLMYNSKPATCFLCCIENCDVTKPITFTPKESENDKGVKSTSLFLNQNGSAVKWAHTKGEPNGMPQAKQTKVNGVDTWDNTEKLEFFEKVIATKILPVIKGAMQKTNPVMEATDTNRQPNSPANTVDDLPF